MSLGNAPVTDDKYMFSIIIDTSSDFECIENNFEESFLNHNSNEKTFEILLVNAALHEPSSDLYHFKEKWASFGIEHREVVVDNISSFIDDISHYTRGKFALFLNTENTDWIVQNSDEEKIMNDYVSVVEKCELKVPRFMQYLLLRHFCDTFKSEATKPSKGYHSVFLKKLKTLMDCIDDDIILGLTELNFYQKNTLIGLKRGYELGVFGETVEEHDEVKFEDFSGYKTWKLSDSMLVFNNFSYDGSKVQILGYLEKSLLKSELLEVLVEIDNGNVITSKRHDYSIGDTYFLGNIIHSVYGFKVEFDGDFLKNARDFKVYIKYGNVKKIANIKFDGPFVRLVEGMGNSFLPVENSMILYDKISKKFLIKPYTIFTLLKAEIKYRKELVKLGNKRANELFFIRTYSRMMNMFKRKKINLFMDRAEKAGDNAEVLYSYFEKQPENKDRNYFIVLRNSADYLRLKRKGYKVVAFGSWKYKLLFLQSDKIISSSGDFISFHPFAINNNLFNDAKNFKYIFVPHGITQADISFWMRKSVKDFSLFTTSAEIEYKGILRSKLQYTERELKLTGLPRFDRLDTQGRGNKNILIMPTWRKNIVNSINGKNGKRSYNEKFKESNYFRTINRLLNDKRLLRLARKNGYTITFAPHPSIRQQVKDFDIENVILASETDLYHEMLNNATLLITDYSSIHFDFSYMKKPVIYYQFDSGNWDYANSFYSFDTMGFGPVVGDIQGVIDFVSDKIESNKMDAKFERRVDSFFSYRDQNNCVRVYDEIEKLDFLCDKI